MSRGRRQGVAALLALLALALAPGVARAADGGFTTLDVAGDEVRIYRDGFGVPHIFAETNRGLFEAYGYVVAQDRLWQLELNRRASQGRLAEIFGGGFLNADRAVRTVGYTNAELDAQFASRSPEEKAIFQAYAAGINRYITEVVAPDPVNKLPFEFHALGIGVPAQWTTRDSVAFAVFMTRRFGEIGGRELTNDFVLQNLIAAHGPDVGYEIFNDARWLNDPDAPTTVPADGAVGKRQKPSLGPGQLQGSSVEAPDNPADAAREAWESLGVVSKLGSYAWAVSPARSANGAAMLYGGPQMGFSAPEVLHEVQLKGPDGFNVTGMAFAGVPLVLIGRNEHVAWTSTTGIGDNVDHYAETLCDGGYEFNGECVPFESRTETINVRGAAPVSHVVRRSVHGPVVATGTDTAFTQKRSHWQRELEATSPFLAFDRARSLGAFERALEGIPTSHNFIYADKSGNIGYWQAGQVPVRPEGFDPRLPFPGDGSAEWPGGYLPIPRSVNPAQGYLANWNNKPSVDFDNHDGSIFGKQFRNRDIDDRLRSGPISLADMRDIPKDIARVKGVGREARFLKPYLIAALDAVPPAHPVAPAARGVVEDWDGNAFADAVSSTTLQSGEVVFSLWLTRMIGATFADELGTVSGEASSNMLIHILDEALGGGSGVPPSRDYFNGADPNAVISAAFDSAVTTLAGSQGDDPSAWTAPRGSTTFSHPIVGPVGTIPQSNRATYAQIAVMSKPRAFGENIFTLGQSGFIRLAPPAFALDSHFRDQLPLYRDFEYKPMRLFLNDELKD